MRQIVQPCATETALQPEPNTRLHPPQGAGERRRRLHARWRWGLTGGALLVAWVSLWDKLRIDWSVNDQYRYGWFVPPLALALLALRWRDRPAPQPLGISGARLLGSLTAFCLICLLPVRLIEEPNGDWRLLFWMHGVLLVGLSLGLAAWVGGVAWARHFAFPVLFLLLGLRWPSEPEQALIQGLMRGVAAITAEGMNLLGLPAVQQGNLIRVRDQLVGVNEACSGIRSLQTVLMAALLLGELSRLSVGQRWLLLGGGWLVAMVANVFRSGLLVWIAAHQGADALGRYHDAAGISVLLIVFAGLLWLNGCLERGNPARKAAAKETAAPNPDVVPFAVGGIRFVPRGWLFAAMLWLAVVETATAGWYRWHERDRVNLPRWTVVPPKDAPGFKNLPMDDVTRSILRYDEGQSARWRRAGSSGGDCTLFFFRWEPGRTSATLAAMHQPRACLPASGMVQAAERAAHPVLTAAGITLPVEEYEFLFRGQRLYVYYVVWQDQTGYALTNEQDSRWNRLRAVWQGQRNLGQQTLEMVISGPSSAEEAAAAFARELDAAVKRKG